MERPIVTFPTIRPCDSSDQKSKKTLAAGCSRLLGSPQQRGHSLVVKRYPSKLDMRVRFPLPALHAQFSVPKIRPTMKKSIQSAAFGAILGMLSAGPISAGESSCTGEAAAVRDAIKANPADTLAVVEKSVSASPGCSCEIVKAAIEASRSDSKSALGSSADDSKTVLAIVRTAAAAAPDQTSLIAKCAASVAPEAADAIQAFAGGLAGANPLDFPSGGQQTLVGPNPGEGGGYTVLPPGVPGSGFGGIVVAPPSPPATRTGFSN